MKSLIDEAMLHAHDDNPSSHPEEGVIIGDTFVRVEYVIKERDKLDEKGDPIPGEKEKYNTGMFRLMKYTEVDVSQISELEAENGKELVSAIWETCEIYFDKQLEVLRGNASEADFTKEVETMVNADDDVKVIRNANDPQGKPQKMLEEEDLAQIIKDKGISKNRPDYEIVDEIFEEMKNRGLGDDGSLEIYDWVQGWQNGEKDKDVDTILANSKRVTNPTPAGPVDMGGLDEEEYEKLELWEDIVGQIGEAKFQFMDELEALREKKEKGSGS